MDLRKLSSLWQSTGQVRIIYVLTPAFQNANYRIAELAIATGEFAQNVTELASSDVGKQLAQSLAGLAEVEKTAQDLQNIQSEQDMATLMATGTSFIGMHFIYVLKIWAVDEYARLINSVRVSDDANSMLL